MSELVDKQAVLKAIRSMSSIGFTDTDTLLDAVEGISTVEERKKGKWIDDGKGLYMCSSCGKLWVHWWARIVPPNRMCKELRYCPMCGAEMEKTDEQEIH